MEGIWRIRYMPQEGDGELIIRDLKSGQELREPAGALPPPVIQTAEETNPDEPPPVRSIRILASSDSRFVVATTFAKKAATDQARREKKRAEDMPKGELLIINLETKAVTRLAAPRSVQMPARGGAWLAYSKEGPPKSEYGTDLVLRDLAQGTERSFANVQDYSFARDGKTLLYTVASAKPEENGVYAVTPGTAGWTDRDCEREGEVRASHMESGRDRRHLHDRSRRLIVFVAATGAVSMAARHPARDCDRHFVHAGTAIAVRGERAWSTRILARRPQDLRARGATVAARAEQYGVNRRTCPRRPLALERRCDSADAARAGEPGSQSHVSRHLSPRRGEVRSACRHHDAHRCRQSTTAHARSGWTTRRIGAWWTTTAITTTSTLSTR